MTAETRPAILPNAVRSGVVAGVIAFVIRLIFALTLEHLALGAALGVSALYFVGTALLVAVGILVVGHLVRSRA